jgi:hypothetical protein
VPPADESGSRLGFTAAQQQGGGAVPPDDLIVVAPAYENASAVPVDDLSWRPGSAYAKAAGVIASEIPAQVAPQSLYRGLSARNDAAGADYELLAPMKDFSR